MLSPQGTLEMPWSGTATTDVINRVLEEHHGPQGAAESRKRCHAHAYGAALGRLYAAESRDLNVGSLWDGVEVRCEGYE